MTAARETAGPDRDRPFSELIEHAIELSAQWHDRTYRKSRWRTEAFAVPDDEYLGVPVMAHVTAVAMAVQRAGFDEETVAAAFLHDVIEDGNSWGDHLAYENLAVLMGECVADRVMEVTEEKFDEYGSLRSWHERKELYIDNLRQASVDAAAISLADKHHNLWSINSSLQNGVDVFRSNDNRRALHGGPDEQAWFFSEILKATAHHSDARLEPLRMQLTAELARYRSLLDAQRA